MTDFTEIPARAGDACPPLAGHDGASAPRRVAVPSSQAALAANSPAGPSCQPAGAFSQENYWEKRRGVGNVVWTAARDDVLRRRWVVGDAIEDIRPELNELPGLPVVGKDALKERARKIGAKRPATWAATSARRIAEASTPWTPARVAHIRDAYPRGGKMPEILDALNALPGGVITRQAVATYAQRNRLFRPDGFRDQQQSETKRARGPWTAERDAIIRSMWPDKANTIEAIREAVNAASDRRPVTALAVRVRVDLLKCPPRPRGPRKVAPAVRPCAPSAFSAPTIAAQASNLGQPLSWESKIRIAVKMLAQKKQPIGIVGATGLPLWKVQQIIGYQRMGLPVL